MQSSDDENLLRRYGHSRDEAAFRELARRYGGLVYGACLHEVRRPDLAEDAAQAVFLDLARKASRIRIGGSLVPWLYKASKHAGRNALRAERRRSTVPLVDTIPAAATETPNDALFQALDALNSSEREAVVLRFVQGFSFTEVGRAQGVSEDAARMRVQRALKRLGTEYVPAFAPPAGLVVRLAALPLPKAAPLMNAPLLFASGSVAALTVAGAVTLRLQSPETIRNQASGTASASLAPRTYLPDAFSQKQAAKGDPTAVIDKPFTLAYHYTEQDLRTRAMREAEAKEVRRRLTPDVDADKMTPEDLEASVASALRSAPPIERDVTLSYDGTTLYID
ncbi:sigma-70 family RNA polymerase sigma factor, partial [bacterium]